jgi:2-dehydropantoate 2-reductase
MSVVSMLIVGAGAAGGYIGAQLVAAARPVTFLVHPHALARLRSDGLRIRHGDRIQTYEVNAVTAADLHGPYDVIVVAVRTDVVESAIGDIRNAVGPQTRIVPVMNGLRHLSLLTASFGNERVLGATTRLVTSLLPDGTINEVTGGIDMQIGQLDGGSSDALDRTVAALSVPNIAVTVSSDVITAMWVKFAFITSTAILTCLVGADISEIAHTDGGTSLAHNVLDEVLSVAAANGNPLTDSARQALTATLTDPSADFGPSMFRDLNAGRPVEITVLTELAERASTHGISTPLLDASTVIINLHNRRLRSLTRPDVQ